MRSSIIAFVVLGTLSSPVVREVSAAPITWQFAGAVDNMIGPTVGMGDWAGVAALGESFTWTVTFDSSTPSLPCPPGSGVYPAISSSTLRIGQSSWTGGAGAVEVNAPDGACGILQSGVTFREFFWSGTPLGPFNLNIFSVAATLFYPFADGSIPTSVPSEAFVQVDGVTRGGGGPGSLTSVTPVPEPASLSLLALGCVAAARWGIRRKAPKTPRH